MLPILGKLSLLSNLFKSKWFWFITIFVLIIISIGMILNRYEDNIRETLTTQLNAQFYKSQYETMLVVREAELEMLEDQRNRIAEQDRQIERQRANFRRDLRAAQASGLEGGTVGSYLREAAISVSSPNAERYEDVIRDIEDDNG